MKTKKQKKVKKTVSKSQAKNVKQSQVVNINITQPKKKRGFVNKKQQQMNTPNMIMMRNNDSQNALNRFMGIQDLKERAQKRNLLDLTNNISELRREIQMQGRRALNPDETNSIPQETQEAQIMEPVIAEPSREYEYEKKAEDLTPYERGEESGPPQEGRKRLKTKTQMANEIYQVKGGKQPSTLKNENSREKLKNTMEELGLEPFIYN